MALWMAQFQQTKSTKAVHARLPHGICFDKGGPTLLSQSDLISDHNPSQLGMYSSVGDKEES